MYVHWSYVQTIFRGSFPTKALEKNDHFSFQKNFNYFWLASCYCNIGNISLATRSGQREQLQVGCLCPQESRTWNLLQTSRIWTNKILPQPLSKASYGCHKEQGRGCQKVKSQGPFQSRVQSKIWTGVKAFHSWTVIRGVVLGGRGLSIKMRTASRTCWSWWEGEQKEEGISRLEPQLRISLQLGETLRVANRQDNSRVIRHCKPDATICLLLLVSKVER